MNGVMLWVEEVGAGADPPVLLLAGDAPATLRWPRDVDDALLNAGLRVVRIDLRDGGRSEWCPRDRYSLDDLASDVASALRDVARAPSHVVGLSIGGVVAQQVALDSPDVVASLACVMSTPGIGPSLSPPSPEILEYWDEPPPAGHTDLVDDLISLGHVLAGSRVPFDESACRGAVEAALAHGVNPRSGQFAAALSAPSRLRALHHLRVPTLVVHGDEDTLFPIDHGKALAGSAPESAFVPLAGVGHEMPPAVVPEITDHLLAHIRRAATGPHPARRTTG